MEKRRALNIVVTITISIGALFAAVPFVSSMSPSLKVREDARLRVDISRIPENGALELDWHGYKVFLVRQPALTAFLMPYWEGSYWLPDPTWERAYIPCEKFSIGNLGFSCIDPKLHENWRENAQWDLTGKTSSHWMPDLETAPYKIEGKYIVISPEYK